MEEERRGGGITNSERSDESLGGGVEGDAAGAGDARERRDEEEAGAAAAGGARGEERAKDVAHGGGALDVHVEQRHLALERRRVKVAREQHGRVVHDEPDVDARAQLARREHRPHVAHVAVDDHDLPPVPRRELRGRRLEPRARPRDQHEVEAALRKALRERAAHTRRRAKHDRPRPVPRAELLRRLPQPHVQRHAHHQRHHHAHPDTHCHSQWDNHSHTRTGC